VAELVLFRLLLGHLLGRHRCRQRPELGRHVELDQLVVAHRQGLGVVLVHSSPRSVAMPPSISSGLTSTSRAFEPSLGPTTPLLSRMSISRPALAKPTRSLRCSIDVDPNCVETTSSTAWITRSMSSPMSSSSSRLAAAGAVTSSRYVGDSCFLQCFTTAWISASLTHEPWTRTGLDAPIG